MGRYHEFSREEEAALVSAAEQFIRAGLPVPDIRGVISHFCFEPKMSAEEAMEALAGFAKGGKAQMADVLALMESPNE